MIYCTGTGGRFGSWYCWGLPSTSAFLHRSPGQRPRSHSFLGWGCAQEHRQPLGGVRFALSCLEAHSCCSVTGLSCSPEEAMPAWNFWSGSRQARFESLPATLQFQRGRAGSVPRPERRVLPQPLGSQSQRETSRNSWSEAGCGLEKEALLVPGSGGLAQNPALGP